MKQKPIAHTEINYLSQSQISFSNISLYFFAQLSSIPGLEQEYRKESDNVHEINTNKSEEVEVAQVDETDNGEVERKDEEKDEHATNKDTRYEKYLKMIHVGVPKQAVKLKMEQEGLDTSVLE